MERGRAVIDRVPELVAVYRARIAEHLAKDGER